MNPSLNRLSVFATLALSAACGTCDAPPSHAESVSAEPQAAGSAAAPALLLPAVVTASGVRISLALPEGEIRAGDLTVTIRAEGVSDALHPRSMDVMSPAMPMHGVARVPLTETSQGSFTGTASIPMSGRWALFINLDDDGAESAEFQFDVLPADASQVAASDSNGGHAR